MTNFNASEVNNRHNATRHGKSRDPFSSAEVIGVVSIALHATDYARKNWRIGVFCTPPRFAFQAARITKSVLSTTSGATLMECKEELPQHLSVQHNTAQVPQSAVAPSPSP